LDAKKKRCTCLYICTYTLIYICIYTGDLVGCDDQCDHSLAYNQVFRRKKRRERKGERKTERETQRKGDQGNNSFALVCEHLKKKVIALQSLLWTAISPLHCNNSCASRPAQ